MLISCIEGAFKKIVRFWAARLVAAEWYLDPPLALQALEPRPDIAFLPVVTDVECPVQCKIMIYSSSSEDCCLDVVNDMFS